MSTEDGVLLIGGETAEAPVRPPPPPPTRRPLVLGVLAAMAIAVVALVLSGSDPASPTGEPAALAPPVEPPPTPPVTESAVPEIEWTGIRIPGTGVVTNVVGGPPGWLAVLLDDRTRVVTSTDGRTWRETPLGAPALGYLPVAASGAGVMAVAGSVPASSTPFASWVSDDAGLSWTPVTFPDDALTLTSMSSAPAGVYATGSRRSGDGGSEPVVWWLEGGPRWTPLPVVSDGGTVVDLVDADGVALAVGYEDGPRLWTMVGREFVPLAASLPDEVATARPLGAVVDGDDRVVILMQQGLDGPLRVVRSTEAGGWELVGKASYTPVSAIGKHRGDPVALGDRAHLIAEEGLVELSTRGQRFLGLDSRSGVSVGGGFELDLALRLWVSGDDGAPVEPVLVAQPETGWSEVATGPGRVPGFLRGTGPGPRAVATADGALISGADRGRVLQARITPSGVELGERSTAGSVAPVGDEAWILGRALTRLEADGSSETLGSPDGDDVAAVAEIDGTIFAADAGGEVFELSDVGWQVRGGLEEAVPRSRSIDVRGADGAFMARRLDDPSVTLVWSGGETWQSVPGTLGASMSGAQFLVRSADPERSVIEVVGEWPATTRLEVPDPYPLEVVVVDGQIRVLTPTQILVTGDGGDSWDSFPLGTVRGTVVMLPTPEIAIVSIDTGETRILVPAA